MIWLALGVNAAAFAFFLCWILSGDVLFGHFQGPPQLMFAALALAAAGLVALANCLRARLQGATIGWLKGIALSMAAIMSCLIILAGATDRTKLITEYHMRRVKALRGAGPPAIPELTAALKDNNQYVRGEALTILSSLGAQAAPAVPALIEALKDARTGPDAAWALGCIGPQAEAGVPALIDILEHDEGPDMRPAQMAAYALGRIGPAAKPATAALTKALKSKDDSLPATAKLALELIEKK